MTTRAMKKRETIYDTEFGNTTDRASRYTKAILESSIVKH